MKSEVLSRIVSRINQMLNDYYGRVSSTIVKIGDKNVVIVIKMEKNISNIRNVKIKISLDGSKVRVYSGVTSLDLKLKRFLKKELGKVG
ncbi:MAG: hypothetical protein QXW58_07515 [Thermosphaera sp.]